MKTYKAMYRCRLCGKAFYDGAEANENQAQLRLFELAVFGHTKDAPRVELLEEHNCGKPFDSIGLADFIGWDAEEEDNHE